MKTLLVLLSLLTWNDPEIGDRLSLTQDIDLKTIVFPAGKALFVETKEPMDLPGAPLLHYVLSEEKCETPDAKSEMEIITPNGNADSTAVGVQLNPGCNWEIFLEQKDIYTNSFFSKKD